MVIHIANATVSPSDIRSAQNPTNSGVSACGKVYLEGRNDSDDVVRR